jgi:tRNA threonylcarbamoyladenosine biosynthesis protein TsaB
MILAFDTATDYLTVAAGTTGGTIAAFHEPAPRAHLGRLLPTVDALLAETGCQPKDIDYIAVGTGPGSFTGLRIGVATAQGLAHALKKPLIGVSTLDIIARMTADSQWYRDVRVREENGGRRIYPIIDAKKGEVYTAEYGANGGRLSDYRAVDPHALASELRNSEHRIAAAGDGLRRYGDIFAANDGKSIEFAPETLWAPNASVLIKLCEERIIETDTTPYLQVLPIYARLSDAEENRKREESS